MNISKRIIHADKNDHPVSDLIITVEYDAANREVERIKTVSTYHYHSGVTTDITAHMMEHFMDQLDSMVDSIDWAELVAEDEEISLESNKLFAEILN